MASAEKARDLWQLALDELRIQMARQTFDTWLKPTTGVSVEAGLLVVGVPSAMAKDWLEQRLAADIERVVGRIAGEALQCAFVVRNGHPAAADAGPLFAQASLPSGNGHHRAATVAAATSSRLNPRYTFGTFVVGSGNRLAHAAAQAVAEQSSGNNDYNPLFVYGGVGLGKTHLLHAIGHAVAAGGGRVLLVTSEQFTNDLINAIGANGTEAFRTVYRETDVLLVDDIQFIAGKERTQEEFFHTFNAVHDAQRRIVMTSDRSPAAISTLEDRLRSRFQWGLMVDIEPPDLETRIAILRAKLSRGSPAVPAPVLELIAEAVQNNVRELEGALNRVVAYAQIHQLPLGADTARRALADVLVSREAPGLQAVLAAVAAVYRIDEAEILGRSRTSRVSEPRQVAMYLMRVEADASYPTIGAFLGGRDHTTALHGHEKVARMIDRDPRLRRQVAQVRELLYS